MRISSVDGGVAAPDVRADSDVYAKELGSGGHQHRPDGVRGGVGERLLLCRPPHAADIHGYGGGRRRQHQQAGAYQQGQEQASGRRPLTLDHSPCRLVPRTGPFTLHVVPTVHRRCRGIACLSREGLHCLLVRIRFPIS